MKTPGEQDGYWTNEEAVVDPGVDGVRAEEDFRTDNSPENRE